MAAPRKPTRSCAGSPALDKGRSFFLPSINAASRASPTATSFRMRAGGDGADIGAFEVNPFGGIIDSDGDGMPDEFEVFFDVDDPNGDPDGDGDNNLDGIPQPNQSTRQLELSAPHHLDRAQRQRHRHHLQRRRRKDIPA